MKSKRELIAALLGMALVATPVTALAGGHREAHTAKASRSIAFHAAPAFHAGPAIKFNRPARATQFTAPRLTAFNRPTSVNTFHAPTRPFFNRASATPAIAAIAPVTTPHPWARPYYAAAPAAYAATPAIHSEPDGDEAPQAYGYNGYNYQGGYNYAPAPPVTRAHFEPDDDDYASNAAYPGQYYDAQPQIAQMAGEPLVAYRNRLLARRAMFQAELAQAQAAGNRRQAGNKRAAIKAVDRKLNRVDRQLGMSGAGAAPLYGALAPNYGYSPYPAYNGYNSYNAANPNYGGYGYGTGYGTTASLLMPLLQQFIP
jgi:hypothetical protein